MIILKHIFLILFCIPSSTFSCYNEVLQHLNIMGTQLKTPGAIVNKCKGSQQWLSLKNKLPLKQG